MANHTATPPRAAPECPCGRCWSTSRACNGDRTPIKSIDSAFSPVDVTKQRARTQAGPPLGGARARPLVRRLGQGEGCCRRRGVAHGRRDRRGRGAQGGGTRQARPETPPAVAPPGLRLPPYAGVSPPPVPLLARSPPDGAAARRRHPAP